MKLYGVELDGMSKRQVKAIKKWFRDRVHNLPDRLADPIWAETRYLWDSDGYGVTEYGILWDMTDEEIEDWRADHWRYGSVIYDCTGELCTRHMHFHRNPEGVVSYIHYMVVDV